ncbi:glycoside hydrolase family 3 N-terminal domain-containing protein [Schumannella sp. 10F1B-5-1]|uniref:glycoside hydrolase family 3 N-terminal domain-containing protein n=1 Tax=Schumannella sp. 10F1B-5-1 TaxID=2590780 RepID=UPI00112FEE6A|nr:glycoside hydrolase family 3 N-terminal domain-containing protein [Schumannella sp. 10F1B-5-1]TPW72779.1 glycoside hydrolase family 3 protein [Schumannella sp. 10F1B-5-1]
MSVLGTLLPGFVGTTLPDWLDARLRDGLAGVCLFGENIVDPAQTRALTDAIRAANPRAIIAIDEEGGDVTRLHAATGAPFPGNAVLGRLDDADLTGAVGAAVAHELAAAGVNLNFAPDVDVNSNPDNPVIGVRSFGADAPLVSRHSSAWIAAHEAAGVAVSAKHFPGHGDTAQDSHLALPIVEATRDELDARELPPFVASIAAGARTIMSSHIVVPALDGPETPATFSRAVLDDLLRSRLGFQGVVVSDALDMAGASGEVGIPRAAALALDAGCDLLCIGTRNTDEQLSLIAAAVDAAIARGELDRTRVDDAAARVAALGTALAATVPGGAELPAEGGWSAAAPPVPAERIRDAFEVKPGVRPAEGATLVSIETTVNIAVGHSPWGVAAAGGAVTPVSAAGLGAGADAGSAAASTAASTAVRDALAALPDGPLVLIGKDNHRHEGVRELIDAARAERPGTIAIDMGWPSPDRAYADVATFGASRIVGAALLDWLAAP